MVAAMLEAWADLLTYPGDGGAARIRRRTDEITSRAPELEADLRPLRELAEARGETELEEAFTRTFDSNAERALEVGWHLHGENYARGVFMVRMRELLREHDVLEHGELPDHVSNVLPVMARAGGGLADALAESVLAPALEKIESGFSNPQNPYLGVVTSLRKYIEREYLERTETSGDE